MTAQTPEGGDLLRRAVQTVRPVLARINDDQLSASTPCTDFDIRALLQHMLKATIDFQHVAAKQPMEPSTAPEVLPADWRDRFEVEMDRLVQAWDQPGAFEGDSPAMGLPQRTVVLFITVDLAIHAWDLATSTGQVFEPDDVLVDALTPLCQEMAPRGREMGAFGPEVEVPDDAPTMDRLLGLLGRDPAWAPAR